MTAPGHGSLALRRRLINRAFTWLCLVSAVVAVLVLITLLTSIAVEGFRHLRPSFVTRPPSRNPEEAGLGPAIWGSIWICVICMLVTLPLGVGTAIFLEEYRPRRRIVRRLHGLIQLNIANLAGVPSIVYGIIGLTALVHMFGVFGNPLTPEHAFGVKWFDAFYDETGEYLAVPVEGRDSPPTEAVDGLVTHTESGAPVVIQIVQDFPEDPRPGMVLAGAEAQRIAEKSWYYIQLPFGRGVLAGGLTLMLVILPIVIISSQEAIRAVPGSLREGALAMGATRWQMIWNMTLPAAVPGIMTGAILAMSRAIGEAAPILIIAGIVFITFTPEHLMDDFTAMPLQIFDWARRPQQAFHDVAAAGIIVLLAVLLTFNAVAVFIRQKFQRPLS